MTESKLSYRRITSNIAGKLDLLEAYLFYCLALNSDCYTLESHIKQESLTKFYGINKTDQIAEWLTKFAKLKLIKIKKNTYTGQYGKFTRNTYILNDEHYVLINNKLYDEPISRELKGFLILLKCKCLNGTNTCQYSQNELGRQLNISKSTVSRHINKAIELGYIKKDKKGIYLLDNKMFIITAESNLALIKKVYPEIITDEDLTRGYVS